MVKYIANIKFRSGKSIDFRDYRYEIERSIKVNNSSKVSTNKLLLKLGNVYEDFFELFIISDRQLSMPTKALVKFSQALINEDRIKPYITGNNQLTKCIGIRSVSEKYTELTDGQFLENIVRLTLNSDLCTDSNEIKKREKLIKILKNLMQSSDVELKI